MCVYITLFNQLNIVLQAINDPVSMVKQQKIKV